MPRADDRETKERLRLKVAEQRASIEYLRLQRQALDEKDFIARKGKSAVHPKKRKDCISH